MELARSVGVNKVLTSRLLRAAAAKEPAAVLRQMPGPEPLRQFAKKAGDAGASSRTVGEVQRAVEAFAALIRAEAGDRSGFDAMLSAWLPDDRAEFELRRKQAVFKSLSQLHGRQCDTYSTAVLVNVSPQRPDRLDVVWVVSLLGLQRLRPDVTLRFATRRIAGGKQPRRIEALGGERASAFDQLIVPSFCSKPSPTLEARRVGEVSHYLVAGEAFGARSTVDLTFAEANRDEMDRTVSPEQAGRRRHFFAEINVPAKQLVFDVHVAKSAAGGAALPELFIYDTSFEGVANVNDPTRDLDRLQTSETVTRLCDPAEPVPEAPRHAPMLQHVFAALGWEASEFAGYRTRIDYPVYGTQVTMAFPAPVADGPTGAR